MLAVKFDPHLRVEETMLLSIHPDLVEITFGVCMAVLWSSNKIFALFSHEYFSSGCILLISEKKKIQYCLTSVNLCLRDIQAITGPRRSGLPRGCEWSISLRGEPGCPGPGLVALGGTIELGARAGRAGLGGQQLPPRDSGRAAPGCLQLRHPLPQL